MADLNPFANFAQGRQLAMQKRAEDRLIEDREREATTRNRLAQLFSGGVPSTPEGRGAVVAEVARTDPGAAMDWSKHFASMGTENLKRRQAEAPFIAAQLGNIRDQAGYEQAVANLAELGVDVSDMPAEYDPERIGQVTQAARYLAEGGGSKQAYKLGPGEQLFSSTGEVIAAGPAEALGGPFEGKSMDAQTNNILLDPNADTSSPLYRRAYNIASQPRESFDPTTGRTTIITPNMSDVRPPGPQMVMPDAREPAQASAPEPIGPPGSGVTVKQTTQPKLSMTEAQQMASFDQAGKDIASATEILFPGGEFDRSAAAAAYGAVPGTDGRTAAQALRRTIEVLLRLRTGAAAPESEVRSYMGQFMPSPLDNQEQATAKRDALQAFFANTQKYFEQGRKGPEEPEGERGAETTAAGVAPPRPSEAPSEPPEVSTKKEYDALPSGSEYRAPDGTLRIKR